MRPFRKKHPKDKLSIDRLFPQKRRRNVRLNFGIGEAIVAAIAYGGVVAAIGTYGAIVATAINIVLAAAASIALSMIANAIFGKKQSDASISNNGRMFNTKSTSEPIRLHYGIVKVGGNWVYCDPSAKENKNLNFAVTWGEGEIEGIASDVDQIPTFDSADGLNDLTIGGIYSGTGSLRFVVMIDSIGAVDTFKWSKNNGTTFEATGITISDTWHALCDAIKVGFKNKTGHLLNTAWKFDAGDGLWLGDKLMAYYEHYTLIPGSLGEKSLVVYHNLHKGTPDQLVDSDLQEAEPLWDDAMRYVAYSTLGLKWNDYAWQSIPEFRATIMGIKVYDPRPEPPVTAFSRNGPLVWNDLMTVQRYALGMGAVRIDEQSIIDAAQWCYTNGYLFDGSIIDRGAIADHFEDILKNFRGFISRGNGVFKLKIYTDDAHVMELTDADIEIEKGIEINQPGIPETPNKTKCIFINRSKHNSTDFAEYSEDAVLAADLGVERVNEISLTGTSSYLQAKKLAKFYYYRSRFNKTFSMLVHPKIIAAEEGDMIAITSSYLEWNAVKVRLLKRGTPQEGLFPCVFQEESPLIYDQTVDISQEDEVWVSPAGDRVADPPTGLTVGETGLDETTAYDKKDTYQELSWDNVGNGVDYILQYKKSTVTKYTEIAVKDPIAEGEVSVRIGKLPASMPYNWRVRQKIGSSMSEWVSGPDFTTFSPSNQNVNLPAIVFATIGESDLPSEDGSHGYIANKTELHNCDSITGWATDSAVTGSIDKALELYEKHQGTGSIKVTLRRYPQINDEEDAINSISVGRYAGDDRKRNITPGSHDFKAIGVKVIKIGSPDDLTLELRRNSDNVLIGSVVIAASSVPTTILSEPDLYTYGVSASIFNSGAGVLCKLIAKTPTHSWSNYYRIYYSSFTAIPAYRLCVQGDALNKYVYVPIGATDISAKTYFKNYIKSSRAGSFLSQSFGESAIGEQLFPITINAANAWELSSSDISGVSAGSRDAVTKVGFKITNMDFDAIIYIDDIFGNLGEPQLVIRRGANIEKYLTEKPFNLALLRGLILPWSLAGLIFQYGQQSGNGTTTLTVPVGKIWIINQIYLHSAAFNVTFNVNDVTWYTVDTGDLEETAWTKSRVLKYGDHIDLTCGNHAANVARCWYSEITADTDISVIDLSITTTTTYTVTANKILVIPYVRNMLADVQWLLADTKNVAQFADSAEVFDQHLIFDGGTVLKTSSATGIRIIGYEVPVS